MQRIFTLLLFLFSLQIGISQAPQLTMTDIYGVEHDLYDDYLSQGTTVIMVLDAAWNIWAEVFVEKGVLQDFHNQFAGTGAAILWVDVDNFTSLEDLQGTGNNGTGYDFIADNPYPIFNPEDFNTEEWELFYYPTVRMICPDGTAYTDASDSTGGNTGVFISAEELFYVNFETAEDIAEAMISLCGTEFDASSLSAQVYADDDEDCEMDTAENGTPGVHATITGTNGEFNRVSNSSGQFGALLADGTYEVEIESPGDLWLVCNNNQTVTIDGSNVDIDFGLQATQDCHDPVLDLSVPFLRRCFDSYMYIDYCNEGTVVMEDGIVELFLNDDISITSSSIPIASQDGNLYTFEIGDLDPWECGEINLVVLVDCDVELGTELCYQAEILPESDCVVRPRSLGLECQEVVGSFDPNDKRAFPLSGTDEYKVLPDTEIKYQIRFQNTGTDTAFNVYIDDQISDLMDLTTLRGGASSHPYEMEIMNERILRFSFDNIMLPDSNVNLLGSNGFVNYYLTQNPGHANGTVIENYADIFFDFNDPVRTNTTYHEVDDGISGTSNTTFDLQFTVSPNPVRDVLRLEIDEDLWSGGIVRIVNLQGKLLSQQRVGQAEQSLDVEGITSGIYLIHLEGDAGLLGTKKFAVIK